MKDSPILNKKSPSNVQVIDLTCDSSDDEAPVIPDDTVMYLG